MTGTFEVYRGSQSQPRQRALVLHETSSVGPGEAFPLVLEVPPSGVTDHLLIFRGRMGLEEDAVASVAFVVP